MGGTLHCVQVLLFFNFLEKPKKVFDRTKHGQNRLFEIKVRGSRPVLSCEKWKSQILTLSDQNCVTDRPTGFSVMK
jgi:hypothetical protein